MSNPDRTVLMVAKAIWDELRRQDPGAVVEGYPDGKGLQYINGEFDLTLLVENCANQLAALADAR